MASGMFPYNTTTHINVLEMKATLMALQHVASVVSEPIHVVCYTDNQVSERILAKGRTALIAISAVLKQSSGVQSPPRRRMDSVGAKPRRCSISGAANDSTRHGIRQPARSDAYDLNSDVIH